MSVKLQAIRKEVTERLKEILKAYKDQDDQLEVYKRIYDIHNKCWTREKMVDYILSIGGYSDRWSRWPVEFTVPYHSNLSVEGFVAFWNTKYDGGNSTEAQRKRAEEVGLLEQVFKDYEETAWSWGQEGLVNYMDDSDCFSSGVLHEHRITYEYEFAGRGGKHLVLKSVEGLKLKGLYDDDFETLLRSKEPDERVDDLVIFKLFDLCVLFKEYTTTDWITRTGDWEAYWQLCNVVDNRIESRSLCKYEIRESEKVPGYFRVVNTETKEESMLGTKEECQQIIEHAERGQLLGSFGLSKHSR